MTGDMVENVYRIVVPSSKHKNNFLNPFPSGFIQFDCFNFKLFGITFTAHGHLSLSHLK